MIKAYRSANEQQTDTKILYTTLSRGSWVDQAQPSQPPAVKHLLGEMAAIVSQEYEATAAGNVVATCVLLGIGERDAGVAAAKKALQLIRSQPTLKYDEVRMLGDLVDAIPRDVLAELVPDQPRDGATETEYFVRAALLEALDRTSDCLAALRTAYERSPENRSINRRLISRSERVGQIAMLAKLLYENLSRSTIMESYEWRTLAHLQLSLFKPADAMSAAQHDASPLGPVTVLQAAMFAGDLDYAWTTLQQFAATGPSAERHWDPTWPDEPSQNGIIGWLAAQQPLHLKRTSLFRAVSELPQVEAAYTDWIRAALPGERNVAGMADGLVDAWRQKGVAAEQLDVLQQLVQDDAATVHDDWLLLQLLSTAPDATAEAATTDYLLASVDLDNYDQLRLLANCHNLPAQAQSDVLLWLMVSGGQYGYRTTRLDQRIDDIKEYIASLPAEARADMTQRLNRFLEPTPLDAPSDSIMAAKLEWLFTVNPVLAETELDACRQQIASNDVLRSYPQTARILARAAAAKQDWEQCRQYVDAALMLNPTRRTTEQVIDTRSLLPDRDAETLEQTVTFVSERLSELYEQSRIARDTYVRSLALLAYACCEREVPELANALRAQIAAQHGEPGEHWLWEADLCRRLGDAPAAHELERTLAMETLLPMTRVARLLAEAEQYGKTGSSERLALRLADVTDHPAVLTRAKAAAQRLQQPEDVAAFDSRLGLWSEAVKKRLEFRISSPESGNKPKAE